MIRRSNVSDACALKVSCNAMVGAGAFTTFFFLHRHHGDKSEAQDKPDFEEAWIDAPIHCPHRL